MVNKKDDHGLQGVRSGFECLLSGVDRRRLARHLHRLQACWVKGMDKWERWAREVQVEPDYDGRRIIENVGVGRERALQS